VDPQLPQRVRVAPHNGASPASGRTPNGIDRFVPRAPHGVDAVG
jgi:hypothetical protein